MRKFLLYISLVILVLFSASSFNVKSFTIKTDVEITRINVGIYPTREKTSLGYRRVIWDNNFKISDIIKYFDDIHILCDFFAKINDQTIPTSNTYYRQILSKAHESHRLSSRSEKIFDQVRENTIEFSKEIKQQCEKIEEEQKELDLQILCLIINCLRR